MLITLMRVQNVSQTKFDYDLALYNAHDSGA